MSSKNKDMFVKKIRNFQLVGGKKAVETTECCQNSNETWGWVKSSMDNMENRQNGNKVLDLVQCSIGTIERHQKVLKFRIGRKGG
jgi:hypothetical protein